MARSNSDLYWKGILEDLFADFLRFFYPNADELFDINKGFEFLDLEVEKLYPVGDPEYQKSVDKLVKVYTRDGKEEWFLIHIEVQGYKDNQFAERMFTYFYRIRDSYGKRVRSIVIFTDNIKSFRPDEYVYRDDDTSVVFRYKIYKVIDQDPVLLEASNNPFAWVILTVQLALQKERLELENHFKLTVDLVRKLYQKGFERKKIENLIDFIKACMNFEKPEINVKFDKTIDQLNDQTRTMGIREQIIQVRVEEVMLEKNIVFVTNLVQATDFSDEKIASLAQVSIEFVQQIRQQMNSK